MRRFRGPAAMLVVVAAAMSAGCAAMLPRELTAPRPVPESPSKPVALSPPSVEARMTPVVPEGLLKPGASLNLEAVVDIALSTSPVTRTAWLQARSAAQQVAVKQAAYYPRVDVSMSAQRGQQPTTGQAVPTTSVYGPSATLTWLLLDLGGRSGDAGEARHALLATDWAHGATVQNVVLVVEQAYFGYQNAKAQVESIRSAVKQAEIALEAATVRHDAGVGTIADVLQARTAVSRANLELARAEGAVLTQRGALVTAMGLPADIPLDVGPLSTEVPIETALGEVAQLIERALASRPELNASRELAEKAASHVRAVRSDGLPSLALSATAGRLYYQPDLPASGQDAWSARLLVTYPLFTGFADKANLAKAREDEGVARAQVESLGQLVVLDVWSSYYALRTAAARVRASRDLLASAQQSEEVALGRYKEGVGTILDLLSAEQSLASARAEEIQARTDFLVSTAQLARATGAITIPATTVTTLERQP